MSEVSVSHLLAQRALDGAMAEPRDDAGVFSRARQKEKG
jgi:hypothetical protein